MYGCEARAIGQENSCDRCGYVWDLNDPEPPACKTKEDLHAETYERNVAKLREQLRTRV